MTDIATANPNILYIDDDKDQQTLVERFLSGRYNLMTAKSGQEGLVMANDAKPGLILLDINMPGMDGYEVCTRLQANEETAYIPVVFVTAMGEEQNRARAFSVGAADYLVKPIDRTELLEKIETHLVTDTAWKELRADNKLWHERMQSADFIGFKEYVSVQLGLDAQKKFMFSKTVAADIYPASAKMGIGEGALSRFISQFLNLPYVARIAPDAIRLGVMPTAFCKANHVLPIEDASGGKGFVLSNPFNLDLIQMLMKITDLDQASIIHITEPSKIDVFFAETPSHQQPMAVPASSKEAVAAEVLEGKIGDHPIIQITNTILTAAVVERASDIHIEPKANETAVRFRIDGDLRHTFTLKKDTGMMAISRLKAQGGMDISEKRKPQDGGFVATLDNRVFNLRLSTTTTPNGESLVMRLLEPYVSAKKLEELGMSDKQVETMIAAAGRSNGIILIVGATGSGKTTTIYSLLHAIDYKKRSIMSVEDPAEYRIPFVNQQQVNEKAGVSFEALLKASVRQDPDVLFMGEVRDGFSAKMAIDFASTGHLTITTLHTSNATTAIFRLERLEIDRGTMADTIIAVVAQKLLKRLCPHCKQTVPISAEEAAMFAPFTDDIPAVVAHPVGCPECRGTGYFGREGIYEVLEFDPQIAEMVRSGASISDIRAFSRNRGDALISTQAIAKARELLFAPKDVFEKALAEEETGFKTVESPPEKRPEIVPIAEKRETPSAILLVEDDEDTRKLLARFLETDGYTVTICEDGIDALLYLGKKNFDLILSDIDMPNLDGFKLLEMVNQKGIKAPVVFLTSRTNSEDEEKGLRLGATDYMKKPIKRELLLLRVKKTLEGRKS